MNYRIKYSEPYYLLQKKKKFLGICYWKTLYSAAMLQYVEDMYKNITENIPNWNKKHGTN